jgi:two-component system response regulator VicR
MNRLLFVEDDANLGMLLKENLSNKGFEVVWCKDGEEGLKTFRKVDFNLCILDIMLPVKDGFSLAKEIRAIDSNVPIIFLTARGMYEDKIKGFEQGCDDYVVKPFSTQELYLRINAILKRTTQKKTTPIGLIPLGRLIFDYNKMVLQTDKETKKLSSKETELLYILSTNKNQLVQRDVILKKIWGNDDYFSAKSMDVYISKVRKLLKEDSAIELLNAYGIGFKLIINE